MTLLQFINHVLLLKDALKGYFLHYLPKKAAKDADLRENARYLRLRSFFLDKRNDAHLLFMSEALPIFQKVQLFLQRDDPIGPCFVTEIFNMMASLGSRFLLPSVCKEVKSSKVTSTTTQTDNHLKEIDVGHRTSEFTKENFSESETLIFMLQVKSFYVELFQTLEHHLKLSEPSVIQFWRALTVLHPKSQQLDNDEHLVQKSKSIKNLARLLPSIFCDSDIQPLIEQ